MDFNKIKEYYERGLWNLMLVKMAVKKGLITKEEFTQITGEVY